MAAAPAGAVPRRLAAVHAGRLAVRAESAAHTAMNAVMGLTFLAAL
ncbi:hypothetical protein ACVGVM_10425 [Pseudonocardia bannensis]|uniref:Uncharacterized protein n=1 Tax=Pseudonocardia bannensis TaxID=630973 RepID=A0A848DRJ6_9PSEU|nr:hypothetical protein [Pseudonocardia bannensis]NMH95119.1 hypothetical protein [Pseudonocardia bannensis]